MKVLAAGGFFPAPMRFSCRNWMMWTVGYWIEVIAVVEVVVDPMQWRCGCRMLPVSLG